jgi:hypothetical protein
MHPRERVLSDIKMCRLAGKEPTPELQERAKKWGVEWPKPPERIRDTLTTANEGEKQNDD